MKQISVSAGILINNDNQILLSQRTADKSFPGQWEFPGGKIESSETAHEALIRELKEELGIDIDNSYLFKRIEHYFPAINLNYCFHNLGFIVCRNNIVIYGLTFFIS